MSASASSSASSSVEGISKEMLDSLVKEAMNREMFRRLSKAKWIAITGLMRRLCHYNGTIYGGAVRSYIQRDFAAKAYYSYCERQKLDGDANYCTPDVHPESYNNRHLFPSDIDVFISETDFKDFMEQGGGHKEYHLAKKTLGGAKYFFESNALFKRALTLQKYETSVIHFCNSVLNTIVLGESVEGTPLDPYYLKLNIDFVIIKDEYTLKDRTHDRAREHMESKILYPPFGNPDFDVNLLCFKIDNACGEDIFTIKPLPIIKRLMALTQTNTRPYESFASFKPLDDYFLTTQITEGIITGILAKRARPVFPILAEYRAVFGREKTVSIDSHRILKMLNKGFTIKKFDLILGPKLRDAIIWAPKEYNYESTDSREEDICVLSRYFHCCKPLVQILHPMQL